MQDQAAACERRSHSSTPIRPRRASPNGREFVYKTEHCCSTAMEMAMITGMHAVVYTRDAEADRAFFRDVLGFSSVDAGGGWLIFAAPPSELACHPAESNGKHELNLMCDDLRAEMVRLGEKGIACGPVSDEGWGLLSTVRLPGGGDLGLYEPHHPTAYRQSH